MFCENIASYHFAPVHRWIENWTDCFSKQCFRANQSIDGRFIPCIVNSTCDRTMLKVLIFVSLRHKAMSRYSLCSVYDPSMDCHDRWTAMDFPRYLGFSIRMLPMDEFKSTDGFDYIGWLKSAVDPPMDSADGYIPLPSPPFFFVFN